MNYTQVYRQVYSTIKKENVSHENAHKTALRITNALNDLYLDSLQMPLVLKDIVDIIEGIEKNGKFGGYDLDDNGNIISGYQQNPVG